MYFLVPLNFSSHRWRPIIVIIIIIIIIIIAIVVVIIIITTTENVQILYRPNCRDYDQNILKIMTLKKKI